MKSTDYYLIILLLDSNINRFLLEWKLDQILRFLVGGGAEQHGLSFPGQNSYNFLHILLETDVKQSVSLVDDQALQVFVHKILNKKRFIKKPNLFYLTQLKTTNKTKHLKFRLNTQKLNSVALSQF